MVVVYCAGRIKRKAVYSIDFLLESDCCDSLKAFDSVRKSSLIIIASKWMLLIFPTKEK